ncbi:hypothetical protein AB0O47_40405 [Streptomyces noursei]|uniref:hypothetical protein n=1 Tax=Streptomyces noursei TaxID=1971 RepID=UPI00344D07E6
MISHAPNTVTLAAGGMNISLGTFGATALLLFLTIILAKTGHAKKHPTAFLIIVLLFFASCGYTVGFFNQIIPTVNNITAKFSGLGYGGISPLCISLGAWLWLWLDKDMKPAGRVALGLVAFASGTAAVGTVAGDVGGFLTKILTYFN